MPGCGGCGIPRLTLARSMPRGRREGRSARVGLPPPAVSGRHPAPCARPMNRAPRASHTSGAPPASPTCAPSSAGESGAGSGGVTREFAGGAAAGGSGAGSGGVTGESSAEAAAHPNAAGGGSVRPGKRCPSMARRTVSTRSACVILAARAAAPSCAAAASAAACSRSMRSLSALSMRRSARARRPRSSVGTGSSRAPSSAIVRSASVRRVSIAMRALSPSAPGSRVRSHSSAKRSVSRCRQIRPSMRSAQRPSSGRARAQRRARGIEGERSPSPERTRATISSMVAPSSIAAATASWIAAGSGSSDEHSPIAPVVLRSLSHCVARIRAREDDRRMERS